MLLFVISIAVAAQMGQTTPITPADAKALATTVFNNLVPPEGKIDARPTAGRSLFVDEKQTLGALQRLVSSGRITSLDFGRSFIDRKHDDVIRCDGPGPRGCAMESDGIFVSIVEAERTPANGQIHIKGTVRWVERRDPRAVDGFDMDFYLARGAGGWQIVRKSALVL